MSSSTAPITARAEPARLSGRKIFYIYAVVFVVISLPFSLIHMAARPDDALIGPLQRMVATVANFSGPWGVLLVRLVDFPNAGVRAFNWALAIGLTVLGALLIGLPLWLRLRLAQVVCAVLWTLFTVLWFGVGLTQIASGLL